MMTLKKIRQTTTPEYLGTEATEADVKSYLDLLAQRWPCAEHEPVDETAADILQTAAFNAWCGAGPAESDSEQE